MNYLAITILFVVLNINSCKKERDNMQDSTPPNIALTSGETKVSSLGNILAFNLLNSILEAETLSGKKENVMISPLSLNFAMAMVWNGAGGNTAEQIRESLGFYGESDKDVNSYFKKMMETLPTADANTNLSIANSIWYHNQFVVKESFLKNNKKWFNAQVASLDFSQESTLSTINDWCSTNTNGKIPKILDKISTSEVMFLINALYFKAPWSDKFDPKATSPMEFNLANGEKIETPTMYKSMRVKGYEGNNFNSITLPFGNKAFNLTVIVPLEERSIEESYQELASNQTWSSLTSQSREREIDIYLPKFKFEYSTVMNHSLMQLGIKDAFDPTKANFSKILDSSNGAELAISKVLQKSVIEINEEGGEAAAITSVGMMVTSIGLENEVFKANRPFLFAIWEHSTGAILFAGKVENPQESN